MKTRLLVALTLLVLLGMAVACAPAQPPAAPTALKDTEPSASAPGLVPPPSTDGSRPLSKIAARERAQRFTGPADMWVQPDKTYVATIVTEKGNIVAELYPDAPQSVNNFITLALNGYYDGLTFHRVEPGFVIQGGDPTGSGGSGPGYTIPAEIKHPHPEGALAWARTGDDVNPERRSSGSQFYVTLAPTPGLDGSYTVFGQVVEGMDVAKAIAKGDKIERIDITTK